MEISFSELALKREISGMSFFETISFSLKALQGDPHDCKFNQMQENAADFLLKCLYSAFEDYSALKLVVDTGPSLYAPLTNFFLYVHCRTCILKTVFTPIRVGAMSGNKSMHNAIFSQSHDTLYKDGNWKSFLKNLAYELKDKDCQEEMP